MAPAHARLVPSWRRATARALILALAWQPIATAAAASRTAQPTVSLRLPASSLAVDASYAGSAATAPTTGRPRSTPAAAPTATPVTDSTTLAPVATSPVLPLVPMPLGGAPAYTATAEGAAATADAALETIEQAPSVTISAPASGVYVGGTLTVTGTVSGGTAPFTVDVNSVAATMTGASFSAAVTASAGALTLTATATDGASQTAQASVNVTVDTTAPALAISSPANGAVVAGPLVAVAGTASDASGTVSLLVNGDPAAVTAGAFSTSVGSADGPATITAVAGDQASNSTTVSINVTVDSAPPVLTVTSPANGALVNAATVQITGTVTDASTTTLTIGGAAVTIVGGNFTHVAPTGSDGSQVYILTATDAAGNETTQSLTVNVDRTAPTLSISSPASGAHVATQPVTVTGLVTDLTTTMVTVNGVAATRTADAWQAVLTLADGPQTLTAVATDAAGNQSTATRNITLDTAGPSVTIAAPAAATLSRLDTIVVSGTVADSSVQSVTVNGVTATVTPQGAGQYAFSASVSLSEGDVALVVTATDSAGHVGTGQVTVTRDSTAPLLEVTAPERLTQRVAGSASIIATDNLALQQIVVTVNGAAAGTFATSPVQVPLTLPSGAAIGDTVTLVAVATDTAGNSATSTRVVRVTGDGAVVGQVLSDTTGLPVPGALVQIGAAQVTTDARGQYSFPTADSSAIAIVSLTGTMSVERQIAVAPEVGTVMVDARLTPLAAAASIGAGGGTVTAGSLSLAVPAGAFGVATGVQLTPLSAQGLPGLLPLGWSPLAAFDLRASAPPAATASLTISSLPATILAVTLAQYNATLHAWTALVVDVPVTAGSVTVPIDATGAYAVVVQDVETTPLAPAVVGAPLPVSTVVAIPLTATSAGVVTPAILPPAGGTATGVLAVQSPLPLPSGTLVQANATETFTLANGTVASEEQRRQDVILYRLPQPVATALPVGFTPTVAAAFPITPSRTFGPADLAQGVVHLDILAGREAVRGQVGGGLTTTVNSGGARVIVPAGAVPSDTVIAITPTVLSSFLPAPTGVEPLGEIVLDLAGQTLVTSAELSLALPGLTVAPTDTLLAARVERLNGVPFLVVVSTAALQSGRVTTVASPGLAGVRTGGRYVFYRVSLPLGWAQTTVSTASGPTPGAIVDGTGLPFAGVTNSTGQSLVPAAEGARTLAARMPATALAGSTATTIVVANTTSVAITIAGTTTTASVTPANNATGVPVTMQVQVQSAAALASSAAVSSAIQLVRASDNVPVATRLVLSTSAQTLAVVPLQRLAPATAYRLEAASLTDALGGLVMVPQTTFTTAADAELSFDTTRLVVGMPGANGLAAITAPAGTFAPGTTVLIVNTGNGIVLSLTVANDGSLSGSIEAAIYDRLLITVSDPIGRTTSLQRSTYVAADGTTAVGSGGGVVTGPGGVEMRVPEGAIPTAATFKIEAVDYAATYPNDPPTAIPGATIGAAMRIETSHEGRFNQEIDLAFARPAAAPDGAFFYVMRRHVLPTGQIVYETLDHAWEEGTGPNAKVVTASIPFAGYVVGGLLAGFVFLAWTFDQALPRKPMVGTITGKVVRPMFVPGEAMPRYVGVQDAIVRAVDVLENGSTFARTGPDGTFALHDALATGGAVNVTAELDGVSVTAIAYQPGPEYQRSDALIPYDTYMVVNLMFPPASPPPTAPSIDVKVYRQVNGVRADTKGIVAVGEPLTLVFTVANPPTNPLEMRVADVNGQAITVGVDDVPVPNGQLAFKADYTPALVGALTIVARVDPYSGPDVTETYIARVVSAGGAIENAPNDPPAVIGARTMPRTGANGVAVTVYPEVSFTEPVTMVPGNVTLTDAQGALVPIALIGIGPGGPVPQVQTGSLLTGLTVQPMVGLKFNTTYTLHLGTGIQDQDLPMPKNLVDYTTTFTTFGPTNIGSGPTVGASALQVVGDRAYVADTYQGVSAQLRSFDISDPVAPQEVIGPGDDTPRVLTRSVPVVTGMGHPTDLAVEDNSALTGGRVLATTVAPQGAPYRPSNVWVYDVTQDDTWQLLGAVTLGTEPLDGIAVRVALRGERLFALTRGIGKGVQVVDLVQARSLLQAATVQGEGSAGVRSTLRMLHTAQQGFAQAAITSTVHVPTGVGSNSLQTDMALLEMVVDGSVAPVIVTTGRAPLAIVNPDSGQILSNGTLIDPPSQASVLAYGSYVAAGLVNGQEYAVVAGVSPAGQYRLVTVSLANPRTPQVAGWLNLPAGVMDGLRTRLLLRDGMAYLGGSAGTTIINLQDPEQPHVAGVIAGMGGLFAVTENNVVVGAQDLFSPAKSNLRTAALKPTAIITQVQPEPLPLKAGLTTSILTVKGAVVPSSFDVQSAIVEILHGDTVLHAAPMALPGDGRALFPAGLAFDPEVRYDARLTVNRGDPENELVSGRRALQPAMVEFTQTTEVDDDGLHDVVKMYDGRPHTTITLATPSTSAGLTVVDVRGTVTDPTSPIVDVFVGREAAIVTPRPDDPFTVDFTGRVVTPGNQDVYVAATAVNALQNSGWDSVVVRSNPTEDGGFGVQILQHRSSVPTAIVDPLPHAFRIELRNAGIPLSTTSVPATIRTDVEDALVILRRVSPSRFESDTLLAVPPRYQLPASVSNAVSSQVRSRRVRMSPGTTPRVVYADLVTDEAVTLGMALVDATTGAPVPMAPAHVAQPVVQIDDMIQGGGNDVRVRGRVTDVLSTLPGAVPPTVTVGPNSLTLTPSGSGLFTFDQTVPAPQPFNHLVVRAANATGAFGLAGRFVTTFADPDGEAGPLTAAPMVIEDDGLTAATGPSPRPVRLKVTGPQMLAASLGATLRSATSIDMPPRTYAFTFTETSTGAGRIHEYTSVEAVLPVALPSHRQATPTTPAAAESLPFVPVEVGGVVSVEASLGSVGAWSGGTEVSGLEIVTPYAGSIINVAQMLAVDGSAIEVPVTVKWHGIADQPTLTQIVPTQVSENDSVYQADASVALGAAPRQSTIVPAVVAIESDEAQFVVTGLDTRGNAFAHETQPYFFTPDSAEQVTPLARTPGEFDAFRDFDGLQVADGVFVVPGVIDGLDLLYPAGMGDRAISEHLAANGLQPMAVRRNAGTLVTASRIDGVDVFQPLAVGISGAVAVAGAPPEPLDDQPIDGDDVTWGDLAPGQKQRWRESYLLGTNSAFGVRQRSSIIQEARRALGLPESEGGRSQEHKDFRTRGKEKLTTGVWESFKLVLGNLLTGGFATAFWIVDTGSSAYEIVSDNSVDGTAAAVAAPFVIRPVLQPATTHALLDPANNTIYRDLTAQYLRAQRNRARATTAAAIKTEQQIMTEISTQLGERAAEDYAERALGLSPFERVCCSGPITGGGATGKFDLVYRRADGSYTILEAKGGQRYRSLLSRLGGRIVPGSRYAIQGTKEYIESVARAMSIHPDAAIKAVGVQMLADVEQALLEQDWSRFEHYFVSAKWEGRRTWRLGKGLIKAVAPLARIVRSTL